MRTLTFLALLLVSGPAFSAACMPTPSSPPEHVEYLEATLSNGDDAWASWKCPDGLHIDTFKVSRMLPLLAKAAVGMLSDAEVQAAYDAWPKASEAELKAVQRRVLVDYYDYQPKVLTPIAYKLSKRINQPAVQSRIGTIAVGELCAKGGKYGTLMLVDRAKVKMDSSIALAPDTAFAVCG